MYILQSKICITKNTTKETSDKSKRGLIMSKFEELLVNKGLYDSIDVSIEDLDELEKMLSNSGYYDYNIDCLLH